MKNSKIAIVEWENEDMLPDDMTDEEYSLAFGQSIVDIVRLFPYVVINGERYYLGKRK